MPEPDPDQTPTITVPASATAPPRPVEPTDQQPVGNGSTAMPTPPSRPPEARPAEERVVAPPPPTSTVLPRTPPPMAAPAPPGPQRSRSVAAVGSRFVVIHPHVSFFSWLADKQGPADASPEERVDRYRRDSPWLFRVCVALDLLVLFVVTAILVGALAAILFKAVFGVV
jgi:hypothetical protein